MVLIFFFGGRLGKVCDIATFAVFARWANGCWYANGDE